MTATALVVVDMLYDFIDGSMACKGAREAVAATLAFIDRNTPPAAKGTEEMILPRFPILFVRDFHPSDHCSFVPQGGPWPPHCVQGTRGAEIHEDLAPYASEEFTFYKGYRSDQEQYSGADARNEADQSLVEVLGIMDIQRVYVCGIATEYCVRSTAEDLLKAGFKVQVLRDALAYVDAEGHRLALLEMVSEGIVVK